MHPGIILITSIIVFVYSVAGIKTDNLAAQTVTSSPQLPDELSIPDNILPLIDKNLKIGLGTVLRPHLTSDGRIIILRQKIISSDFEDIGFIRRLTYREIEGLDAGWWQGGSFKGLYVPTIEEICDSAARYPLNGIIYAIDYQQGYKEMGRNLAAVFKKYNMAENVVWYNIPSEEVNMVKRIVQNIKLGYLAADKVSLEIGLMKKSCEYLLVSVADKPWITVNDIKRIKSRGKQVIAVLMLSEENDGLAEIVADELRNMGFDEVMRDYSAADFSVLKQAALREISRFTKTKMRRTKSKQKVEYERIGNMVRIPAGSFFMGSNSGQGFSNELPYHPVNLDDYYIDMYEVTVMDYVYFLNAGNNDVHYHPLMRDNECCGIIRFPNGRYAAVPGREDYPVTYVTWEDATAYAQWARKRLPTEAEWEKAARGGLVGKKFPNGSYITQDQVNYSGVRQRDFWKTTSPVGAFAANGYGLHDMSGNVWEWVQDLYHPDIYEPVMLDNPVNNPEGDFHSNMRVIRGGSWADENEMDSYLRCSARGPNYPIPESWGNRIGFRCASSTRPTKDQQIRANLDYLVKRMKESNPGVYDNLSTDSLRSLVINTKYVTEIPYESEIKSMRKAVAFSMILPGAGELYTGRYYSSILFLGLEIAGWSALFSYQSKAGDIDEIFSEFADTHFDHSRYLDWLFEYREVHNGKNPPNYNVIDIPGRLTKNEAYYHRIAVYDQYLAGWDDYKGFGNSKNREHYVNVRWFRKRQRDEYLRRVRMSAYLIAGNHLFSILDTIWGIKRHSIYRSQGWSWDMDQRTFNGRPLHSMNVKYRW